MTVWRPNLGAWVENKSTHFRVWAPEARSIDLVLEPTEVSSSPLPLKPSDDGFFQRSHPGLFLDGDCLPLQVEGEHSDRVVAFARHNEGNVAITVAPKLVATLMEPEFKWQVHSLWQRTRIILPQGL